MNSKKEKKKKFVKITSLNVKRGEKEEKLASKCFHYKLTNWHSCSGS